MVIDDPIGAKLDVMGNNEYIGWYDGLPEKADGVSFTSPWNKALIMSEFGGGALAGHHATPDVRWTEEYQEDLYEHQLTMLERIPFLRGTAPWILMDFRSPRRPLPGIQDDWNRKGVISERGQRKKAFYTLQQFYAAWAERERAGAR
jgi:beta-glucuronidase